MRTRLSRLFAGPQVARVAILSYLTAQNVNTQVHAQGRPSYSQPLEQGNR
ncbi:Uncharacterised protein [Bordetella ansorpii]|uniref:Uncharacterized protein n=1 Tax=Bordetella ansorpii TaxID=288768 RepID=A0A157QQ33_9BORD|nr:Uncharacterised protein [Bordetella ansorpii]